MKRRKLSSEELSLYESDLKRQREQLEAVEYRRFVLLQQKELLPKQMRMVDMELEQIENKFKSTAKTVEILKDHIKNGVPEKEKEGVK